MTDETPLEPRRVAPSWPPGHPLYAPALTSEESGAILARLEQNQRESREHARKVEQAWQSPEGQKIREIIVADGNVDWPEFVKHCGGILEVVTMVDEYGLPDTDKLIPKVDELFDKHVQADVDAGSVFRRRPRNRPYVPGRGTAAGEANAAMKRAEFAIDKDAEQLLREEAEAANRPRTTHPR